MIIRQKEKLYNTGWIILTISLLIVIIYDFTDINLKKNCLAD